VEPSGTSGTKNYSLVATLCSVVGVYVSLMQVYQAT